MCTALEWWHQNWEAQNSRLQELRHDFETTIHTGWPRAIIIGGHSPRLSHVSNIAFLGLDRQALFMALDQAGIACSTGSACASGSSEPSPAHVAMRLSENATSSALRFSLGVTTTRADVEEAARRILKVCNDLRRQKEG
jgi:cysteine desulfurase